MRNQVTSNSVNVEVDAKPQRDIAAVMEEIRSQYEGVAEKNRKDMEAWYKGKVRRHYQIPVSCRCISQNRFSTNLRTLSSNSCPYSMFTV